MERDNSKYVNNTTFTKDNLRTSSIRYTSGAQIKPERIQEFILQEVKPLEERWTPEQVRNALFLCKGNLQDVAYSLECSQVQLMDFISRHPEMTHVIGLAKYQMAEQAENALLGLLRSDKPEIQLKAAKILLQNLGESLGWKPESKGISKSLTLVNMGNKDPEDTIRGIFGQSPRKDAIDVEVKEDGDGE